MKNFQGKTVVITGAGSGIGQALAVKFSELGAHLALSDNKPERFKETEAKLKAGTKVFFKAFDVSSKEDFLSFSEEVIERFGRVDVVINNAGVSLGDVSLNEVEYEDFEWLVNINFWGVVYGSKAFLPHLRKNKESSLVNISSLYGLLGTPTQSHYCATKFAVRGFNASLFLEEKILDTGVMVSSVHPGGIQTNVVRDSRKISSERLAKSFEKALATSPEKAAEVIIKGIKKKKRKILIGRDAFWISTIHRFFPSIAYAYIIWFLKKKTIVRA